MVHDHGRHCVLAQCPVTAEGPSDSTDLSCSKRILRAVVGVATTVCGLKSSFGVVLISMAGVAGLVARGAFLTGCPLHARTAAPQTRIVTPLTIEAAHKKGAGSTKNGRDSNSKRRGVKVYGGQPVKAGGIIVRQLGTHV